nr:hypothetical protein OH820_02155 [Streptomyces sp. NBC_00857]
MVSLCSNSTTIKQGHACRSNPGEPEMIKKLVDEWLGGIPDRAESACKLNPCGT